MLETALAKGSTAYLTKPLHWATFGSYVAHLLEVSSRARRAQLRLEEIAALVAAQSATVLEIAKRASERSAHPNSRRELAAVQQDIAGALDALQLGIGDLLAGDGSGHAA